MEYLDFELPIKDLQEQYEKACQIGEHNDVDVTNTCEQIELKLEETKKEIYKNTPKKNGYQSYGIRCKN